MHPTENTTIALPNIIDGYREKGLALVTVSKILQENPVPWILRARSERVGSTPQDTLPIRCGRQG